MRHFTGILALCLAAAAAKASGQVVKRVCSSGCDYSLTQMQQAIDDAQPGWIIEIASGQTVPVTSALFMRNKGDMGGNYVTIRSSAVSNLTPDKRVTPSDTANLAKILLTTSSDFGVLASDTGASFYRFQGIDFAMGPAVATYNLINLGTLLEGRIVDHELSQLAHDIVFDQCYIHGNPGAEWPVRGIAANSGRLTITNSWISDIKSSFAEGQAVAAWSGAGPFYFRNNHLSSSTITTLFGGATPNIPGLRATGLTFLGNHYYRPWTWRSTSGTTDPSGTCLYDVNGGEYYKNTAANTFWRCDSGAWTSIPEAQFSAGFPQKNQFELKNASQALVEGNLLENGWMPGALNQKGAAFLMNQVDNVSGQTDGEPAAVVEYVNIRYNLVKNTPWGVNMGLLGTYYQPMHDIFFDHNVFKNLGEEPQSMGVGTAFQTTTTGRVRYSHNTVISPRTTGGMTLSMDGLDTDGSEFYGNIAPFNQSGLENHVSGAGNLWDAFSGAWTLNRAVSRNVIINNQHRVVFSKPATQVNLLDPHPETGKITCPSCGIPEYYDNAGNNDVGFVNFNLGDLHLAPTSRFKGWAHLGKDAGADIDAVQWSTEHAEDGAPNPYFDFVVRRIAPTSDSAQLDYTSYDSTSCTVTISGAPDFGSPVSVQTDTAADRDRTLQISGLTANTRYFYRLACGLGGHRRDGVFLTLP